MRRRVVLQRLVAAPVVLGLLGSPVASAQDAHTVSFFPNDNAWNLDISTAPVDPNSAAAGATTSSQL
jgi:hypothetical protein